MSNMAVTAGNDNSLKRLFKNSLTLAVRGYDSCRNIVYWNSASEKLYGYSAEEVLGKNLDALIIPEHLKESVISNHNAWLNKGLKISSCETSVRAKCGRLVNILSNFLVFKNEQGYREFFTIDIDLSSIHDTEVKLDESNSILDAVFDATPDLYFFMDSDGTIIDYRAGSKSNLYSVPKNFLGKRMQEVLPAEVSELFTKNFELVNTTNQLVTFEYSLKLSEGTKYFEARMNKLTDSDHMLIIVRDITETVRSQQSLERAEQWQQDLFNNTSSVIYTKDLKGKYLSINSSFEQLLHVRKEDIVGKNDFEIYSKEVAEILTANDKMALKSQTPLEVEEFVSDKRGEYIYSSIKFPLRNEFGETYALCGISTDITERKKAEIEVLQHAHFDSLTGLPNRLLMLDRLSLVIDEADKLNEQLAVLFIDLDDFKKINDSLGHDVGDSMLVESSERLKKVLRRKDTIGRLGGDEFLLLLRNVKEQKKVLSVLESILDHFHEPFSIANRELLLTVSIGIAMFPDDGKNATELLRNSDTAMFKAKSLGRDTYSFFTEEMNKDALRRFSIEEQIHGALERNEFEVYYQPQINVLTGEIIGAEALLRWHNSVLGNVSPMEFIPIAEHCGHIIEIGKFVLKEALSVLAYWQQRFGKHLRIAVNLSPRQFKDNQLVNDINKQITLAGVAPESLELEITEGVLMTGLSSVEEALRAISVLGVVLSMDDFGTGYSSLSYLRQYPFDVVKIDKSFVNGITEKSTDRELVSATIAMAHSLGLKVVAEGVETKGQLDILETLKCDYAQGYYLGKPMPVNMLFEFLKTNRAVS